ncbi:30S ribosomal protein S6--L-glutamate ligase [Pectobacteriaceae bacterium CE90]|nr:30S ribosomal protein S6--L-glutamate ligase [Prodigiosinella sp. LS101]WJV55500.1 30S ribosomal protein S6--L-glutamate ligase [Prodigiosinella sp. LS101]WJV59861.1 30S ribosomal protein S6--L-glutamate ligase [Pectobacteriaceae bacterium C111]WJY13446.1 30S ribosomal protein S6--L-glutamate ligase [Pectobacteriaceae bacterium CE90]
MKIAILSRDGSLYSCERLREAATERRHSIEIIDPLSCYMNINSAAPSVHYRGRQLDRYDAVIPRIGTAITFYGTAVLRQFEMLGSFVLNNAVAVIRARDKLHSLQLLARQGIDLPITGFAHSPDDTGDLIKMVGGAPLVVKLVEGTQGIGVVLAETQQAAESVIDAFRGLNAHILVQEYIREAEGKDIRCLVIGDRVVAAIERQAKPGDFRSNLHRGGSANRVQISSQERAIAVKAAKTLGLNVAGVDILRAKRGPLVMEVNASPGLEGIETTTGLDIAGMMIEFIEQHRHVVSRSAGNRVVNNSPKPY